MKKLIFIVPILLFSTICLFSQEDDFFSINNEKKIKDEKEEKFNKWMFGGNIGLAFGSYSGFFDISPLVGYKFNDFIIGGGGFSYSYQRYGQYDLSLHNFGPKAFVNLRPFAKLEESGILEFLNGLSFHSEYELMKTNELVDGVINQYYHDKDKGDNILINNVLVGGGLFHPFQKRGGTMLLLLWDITQHEFSPYINPLVRVYVFF